MSTVAWFEAFLMFVAIVLVVGLGLVVLDRFAKEQKSGISQLCCCPNGSSCMDVVYVGEVDMCRLTNCLSNMETYRGLVWGVNHTGCYFEPNVECGEVIVLG